MLVDNLGQLIQHHPPPQSFQPGDCGRQQRFRPHYNALYLCPHLKKTAALKWFCNHCFTAATFRLFLFLSIFKLTIFPWMTTYWSMKLREKCCWWLWTLDIALIIYCWKIALLFSFLYLSLNLLFTIFFPCLDYYYWTTFPYFLSSSW